MDANPASTSSNGFDAALKALEDLETSVVQTREDASEPKPAVEPVAPVSLSDGKDDAPVAIVAVPIPEAVEPEPEAPAPAPVIEPDVASTVPDAAVPPAAIVAPAGPGKLAKAAIGLGLISSVISGAGLLVANRTIISAQLVVADARERQQQLEHAGKLIHDLELVRDKQIELLQRQQAQLASTPVTSDELQRKLDALQTGLLERDPLNDVTRAVNTGQAMTNARLNEFGMKMARVEAALDRQ